MGSTKVHISLREMLGEMSRKVVTSSLEVIAHGGNEMTVSRDIFPHLSAEREGYFCPMNLAISNQPGACLTGQAPVAQVLDGDDGHRPN